MIENAHREPRGKTKATRLAHHQHNNSLQKSDGPTE